MKKEAIKEFKEIYFKEFGVRLSMAEATEKATWLFNLFKVLLKKERLDKAVQTRS